MSLEEFNKKHRSIPKEIRDKCPELLKHAIGVIEEEIQWSHWEKPIGDPKWHLKGPQGIASIPENFPKKTGNWRYNYYLPVMKVFELLNKGE